MPKNRTTYHKAWREAHKEKEQERLRKYYQDNREQITARRKAKIEENPEKYKARACIYSKKSRVKHPDYKKSYDDAHRDEKHRKQRVYDAGRVKERSAYKKSHRDQYNTYDKRRRAAKKGAPINDFTLAQWQAMKEHYKYRCVYCSRKMQKLTQDHLTPLSRGGSHTASNIVPACRSCNSRKQAGAPLVPVQPLLLTLPPSSQRLLIPTSLRHSLHP